MRGLLAAAGIGAATGVAGYVMFKAGLWAGDRAYRTYDYWMRKRNN